MMEVTFIQKTFQAIGQEMGPELDHYEWWLFTHQHGEAVPKCLDTPATKPRILFWMSDEHGNIPHHLMDKFHAVFKVYIPAETGYKNLFHFPLGYNSKLKVLPPKPMKEREISVYFDGNLNRSRVSLYRALSPVFRHIPHRLAVPMLAVLKRIPGVLRVSFSDTFPQGLIHFYIGFMKGSISIPPYSECLVNTKIALCPGGFVNPETFRHLEALRGGAVIISPKLPPKYMFKDSPIIQVDTWDEGLKVAADLLKDENRLEALQQAGLQWWEDVCSEAGTARYVAQSLRELAKVVST
ncbi:MAG: hypothetical protein D6722_10570 [Bacteroidetes bacterium]|nr:MAG: hypothetical protein D6722_10570 [Bacteroidota bacterium]